MITIKRNSTKLADIFANAKNVNGYSLDNGFIVRSITGDCVDPLNPNGPQITPQEHLARKHAQFKTNKLYQRADGYYILHIHSNLWYEFNN